LIRFIISRLLQAIPVLFGLSVIVFTAIRVVPGAPVRLALGVTATEEQVNEVRQELGLDQPLPIQYIEWVSDLFRGDWGRSLRTGNNVLHDILGRLPATFELVALALVFGVIIAIPLGMIAASNKDRWPDHSSRIGALTGVSMPRFWLAIVLQVLFVGMLGLFPLTGRLPSGVPAPPHVTGLYLVDSLLAGQLNTFITAAHHLVLPVIAQGTATVAVIMRLLRSEAIEELSTDYVTAMRAYGLPNTLIHYKYILKNAFSSSLTIIGLQFGALMGNAFLVEFIFAWPGMARYGVVSLIEQDINAVSGVVLIVGIIFVTTNLIVDILYGYLDPRVRIKERG